MNKKPMVPAALIALAAALPSAAGAATVEPRPGHYVQVKDNVIVVIFDVYGGKVRNWSHNDTCARFQVPVPAMAIGTGAFSFTGSGIENAIDHQYSVRVRGHGASRTLVRGTMTYEKTSGNGPNCKVTTKFAAQRTGKARKT